jgi:hypothetical protein
VRPVGAARGRWGGILQYEAPEAQV